MPSPSPSDRSAVLEASRRLKMAHSAHSYVRGNTAKFYQWLLASPVAKRVPEGPSIWICGDRHLGNLGPLVNGDGHVEIQIRDLDQAVIGNPAFDLIRPGLSLAIAARGSDPPSVTTARMIEDMVEGYPPLRVEILLQLFFRRRGSEHHPLSRRMNMSDQVVRTRKWLN